MAAVIPLNPLERAIRDGFGGVRLQKVCADQTWRSLVKIDVDDFFSAATADEALSLIKREFERLPSAALKRGNWLLSIPPAGPDGFAIDVCKTGDVFRCFFGDMEEECDSLEKAFLWVGRALSCDYQLRKVIIGKRTAEWHLEKVDGSADNDSLAVGSPVLFKWFLGTTTVIQRNGFAGSVAREGEARPEAEPQTRSALSA